MSPSPPPPSRLSQFPPSPYLAWRAWRAERSPQRLRWATWSKRVSTTTSCLSESTTAGLFVSLCLCVLGRMFVRVLFACLHSRKCVCTDTCHRVTRQLLMFLWEPSRSNKHGQPVKKTSEWSANLKSSCFVYLSMLCGQDSKHSGLIPVSPPWQLGDIWTQQLQGAPVPTGNHWDPQLAKVQLTKQYWLNVSSQTGLFTSYLYNFCCYPA